MTTLTLSSARRTTWPVGLTLGALAGGSLVVAGVWNALIQDHVTVDAPPSGNSATSGAGPDVPPLQAMHTYYSWYATTVAQQRAATILGMIGVIGLVLVTVELRRRLASDLVGRTACTAAQAGGLIWVVGALAAIGGDRAVALMATHGNPIDTVNVVAFTTDVTSDAFSAAGLLLLGLAMLGLAATGTAGPRWALLSGSTGLLAVVVAYGYVAGIDSITTDELGILAAVLTPVWLVWTGRVLDRPGPSA